MKAQIPDQIRAWHGLVGYRGGFMTVRAEGEVNPDRSDFV